MAIAGVARHPLYRTGNATTPPRHDLALVELEEEVAVVAACLPAPGTRLEGRRGAVVRGGQGAPVLSMVPVLGGTECLAEGGAVATFDQVCAGRRGGEGPCAGDSGAPLMVEEEGRWVVGGLVSHGPSLCGASAVTYTRVEPALPWVLHSLHQYTQLP